MQTADSLSEFVAHRQSPLPDNWLWLEKDVIGGTSYPAQYHLNYLINNNVGLLVTLTEGFLPYDLWPPIDLTTQLGPYATLRQSHSTEEASLTYLHIPIDDFSVPTYEAVDAFLSYVDEYQQLNPGKAIGLHCLGGTGRTGLMMSCYVAHRQGLSGLEAVRYVRLHYKPRACETQEQAEFVASYVERRRRLNKQEKSEEEDTSTKVREGGPEKPKRRSNSPRRPNSPTLARQQPQ